MVTSRSVNTEAGRRRAIPRDDFPRFNTGSTGNARYNCPVSMTTHRRSLATLAALVSGVALITAQPGDMAGRIRAEGQQRSRALALFRTLTDDK